MSYDTGLSGLTASNQMLDVIGNNIANANTVGAKSSTAEFASLVASAMGAGGQSTPGIGVTSSTIAQSFSQGDISVTGNNLDLAINGDGFFMAKQSDGSTAYTRDGQFTLSSTGELLTASGANVMGYLTNANGVATTQTPAPLSIPSAAPIPAVATTTVTAGLNLDSSAPIASVAPVTPLSTYGTSITTYDTQGNAVPLSLYFTKVDPSTTATLTNPIGVTTPATDQWAVYDSLATTATPIGYMAFNGSGTLTSAYDPTGAPVTNGVLPVTLANTSNPTAGPMNLNLNLSAVTEYGTPFAVSSITQDGYTSGQFTSLSINSKGIITTTYSNGQSMQSGGMVALATFPDEQGLTPVANNMWLQTYDSGAPVLGNPSVAQFGSIQSGAVENSNVNLTNELVNMMTAQRDYQANAQTIKTEDQVMQTLVNLR